jgi:ActR/RegA family two-component response regulator
MAASAGPLAGRHVLLVEDDYFLAQDLVEAFVEQGAAIVGPASNVEDALALIERTGRIDGAVLDINLRGEKGFPVADILIERGVSIILVTGYDAMALPPRYASLPRHEKPADPGRIVKALFG